MANQNHTKIKLDYQFFQFKVGTEFTIEEFLNFTGRKMSNQSVKSYISKKWSFFIEKRNNKYFINDKIKSIKIDQFISLYEQKNKTILNVIEKKEINETVKIKKQKNLNPQLLISPIESISINQYFCIEKIYLENLSDKKEIYFLGENGVGKTILLQSIILALKGNQEEGDIINYLKYNNFKNPKLDVSDINLKKYSFSKTQYIYENAFAYGVSRFKMNSEEKDETGYLTLFSYDKYLENPVKWLQKLKFRELEGNYNHIGLEKAKELIIDLLDKKVQIEVSSESVIFIENETRLQINQLSDGYRSVIIWVSDLLTRLSDNQPNIRKIQDFKGIVIIDELDMFLHPLWEYKIMNKIRYWFPDIQFIISTHSPVLVLGASADSVFYKVYKENGFTQISEPYLAKELLHLMANSIITSPLFDLEDATMANNNNSDIDTSSDYLYSIIHKQIKHIANQIKAEGQVYFSKQEIEHLVKKELEKYNKN